MGVVVLDGRRELAVDVLAVGERLVHEWGGGVWGGRGRRSGVGG